VFLLRDQIKYGHNHVSDVLRIHFLRLSLYSCHNFSDGFLSSYFLYIHLFRTKDTCKCTDMRRLTTGMRSEKCVVRRFRRCANVIECTYTNLDSIALHT